MLSLDTMAGSAIDPQTAMMGQLATKKTCDRPIIPLFHLTPSGQCNQRQSDMTHPQGSRCIAVRVRSVISVADLPCQLCQLHSAFDANSLQFG